jgi:tagatose 6-phosphate kinase
MILTVTLNPMLDKTVSLDHLRRGAVHRSDRVETVVGGKGVNVARQLQRLGEESCVTGFAGGEVGSMLERLLTEEGLEHAFIRIRGMTREGVTYRETDNTWTAIFEPPHHVRFDEAEELARRCAEILDRASWVVCSGSSPCMEADELYARIVREARGKGRKSYLDSYGPVFRNALRERPTIVQCNSNEFAQSWGRAVTSDQEKQSALHTLLLEGATLAVLTDGPRAVWASDGKECWKAIPPAIQAVNPTGSGDSTVGGILWKLEKGAPFPEALRFGVGAGAANAMRWGVATAPVEAIEACAAGVELTAMMLNA